MSGCSPAASTTRSCSLGQVGGVDRLDHQLRAAARRERALEGLDQPHRVLASRGGVVVVDEHEQEAVLGQPQLARASGAPPWASRPAASPARPAPARPERSRRRCAGRRPRPRRCARTRVSQPAGNSPTSHHHSAIVWRSSKNERPDLARERRDPVAVHADDVDRVGRRVGIGVGELGVLTTGGDQLRLHGSAGTPLASRPAISSRAASPSPSSEVKKPATFTPHSGSRSCRLGSASW